METAVLIKGIYWRIINHEVLEDHEDNEGNNLKRHCVFCWVLLTIYVSLACFLFLPQSLQRAAENYEVNREKRKV